MNSRAGGGPRASGDDEVEDGHAETMRAHPLLDEYALASDAVRADSKGSVSKACLSPLDMHFPVVDARAARARAAAGMKLVLSYAAFAVVCLLAAGGVGYTYMLVVNNYIFKVRTSVRSPAQPPFSSLLLTRTSPSRRGAPRPRALCARLTHHAAHTRARLVRENDRRTKF